MIASVIYNRLRDGIRLGIDATTRFAVGNWKRPLRQSELAEPSPYNTRVHAGLPPARSATPASPRSRPRRGRPRPATSSTWSSRAPAASTTSPRPTPSSSAT